MKTKYMMSWGLAFAEKYEMKKLAKKASQGWLLESFAFLGYNLTQGPKQELNYTLDFQSNPDKDYFDIFKSAGWQHVTSSQNQIHVFSAPKGTAPIYSGNEIAEGKYKDITSLLGKGALYSLVALIVFSLSMILSKSHFELLYYPLFFITLVSLAAFIFCFMPYVMYKIKNKTDQ